MSETVGQKITTLKVHSVGLAEAVAQSAALIAPAAGATVGNIFIAGLSGLASPFAFLLGAVVCVAIAKVIGDYARKLPSAGSFYTYLTQTFGPKTGFVTGLLLFGAYVLLFPFQLAFFGFFVHNLVATVHSNIPWQLFAAALIILSTSLAIAGVRPSLRTGLIGLTFEVTIFTILTLLIIFHGGATGNSIKPFNPGEVAKTSDLLLATVFTIFAFVGFESATTLGEEAREPTKTIPRAVLLTTLFIGIFYILVSYSEVIGFGVSKAGLAKLQSDQVPFNDLALRYGNGALSFLVNLAVISSFTALNIVTVIAASRMIYAMGRDKLLPPIFSRVNRRGAPYVAALGVLSWGLVVPLGVGSAYGPEQAASWFAFLATLFFIGAYVLLAVGIVKFYYQRFRSEFNWFGNVLVPLIALLGMGWVTYGNVHPIPPFPLDLFIWITIAFIILAYLIAWYLERVNPQRMLEAGQLFAATPEVTEENLASPALS